MPRNTIDDPGLNRLNRPSGLNRLNRLNRSWSDEREPARDPGTQPATRPTVTVSKSTVVDRLPSHSRKPGKGRRAGQRSAERRLPIPRCPADPAMVLAVLKRYWRPHGIWRERGLAVLGIAPAMREGGYAGCSIAVLTPVDVLSLRMPASAWLRVGRWLSLRRRLLGAASDLEPWGSAPGSAGCSRALSWAAAGALHHAGAPAWRLPDLRRLDWPEGTRPVDFATWGFKAWGRHPWVERLLDIYREYDIGR